MSRPTGSGFAAAEPIERLAAILFATSLHGYGRANYAAEWDTAAAEDPAGASRACWMERAREVLEDAGLSVAPAHSQGDENILVDGMVIGLKDAAAFADKRADAHGVLDERDAEDALRRLSDALREKIGRIVAQENDRKAKASGGA